MSQPPILLSPPAGAESEIPDDNTLDQDVFDGIEDIYTDLESNPPPAPPASAEHIALQSQGLNLPSSSSSESTTSDESSIGINKNDAVKESQSDVQEHDSIPYLCGVPKNSTSRLGSLWNTLTNPQSYFEIKEEAKKNPIPPKQPRPVRVKETVVTPASFSVEARRNPSRIMEIAGQTPQSHDVEMKTKIFDEADIPSTPKAVDTIIHHTIDEVEEEPPKKGYAAILEILQQKAQFGHFKENEGATDIENDTNGNSKNLYSTVMTNLRERRIFGGSQPDDDDAIRRKKMKKYEPSFWSVLGQRKFFGVSHRLLLLVAINLFALMLLIILVTQLTGRKEAESLGTNAQISSSGAGAPTIEAEPVDSNAESNTDSVKSEMRALCDEVGITREDGVILLANQVLETGEYYCSPSKTYIIGMMDDLAIVDIESNEVIWAAGVTNGARTVLLEDGNMFIENDFGDVLWNTGEIPGTDGFFNPQLVFWEGNEGLIALQKTPIVGANQAPYTFWMEGAPQFDLQQSDDLEFPVRGALYFPTFDNSESAWQDMNGELPWHYPSMGYYSSSDPAVVTSHVEAMEYGKIDLGIAFWLGSGTNFDRSRITMLLDETNNQNANLKWTVSYEVEQLRGRISTEEIQSDLAYLKQWFAGHRSWARIDGKPVLYVHNEENCDATERWMSGAATDWYVVMKIFGGYERCDYQPDSWFDNEINDRNDGVDIREGMYHNLAPGHWRKGRRRPDLERLSPGEWCQNVQAMQDSSTEQWHLITSFNDANKGTAIEPSLDWRSNSRYGFFLDCLHDPQMF